MRIEHDFIVASPVEHVWRIVGDEFADIGTWASAVKHSTAAAPAVEALDVLALDDLEGAPVGGRSCAVTVPGFGEISETITAYDATDRTLTYRIDQGLPRFVTRAENTWTLTAADDEHTTVRLRGDIETRGVLGRMLTPLLRLSFRRTFRALGRDLDTYARSGEVSDTKRRRLASTR